MTSQSEWIQGMGDVRGRLISRSAKSVLSRCCDMLVYQENALARLS